MYWIDVIIVSLFLQALVINSIDGNVIRRRRQQPSGASYGNANAPAGYNYPSNTNYYGTNLNNQGTKEFYANPAAPSNTGINGLNNNQQQQQQQQQLYGQPLSNPSSGLYSASGTNPLLRDPNGNIGMRDSNGNLIPAGSPGSSLYSASNPQMGSYPANTNQFLTKDTYNPTANINDNNMRYAQNSNPNPNSNIYSGQMGTSSNNNNAWPTNNNNNQYGANTGNAWNQNRNSVANNNANPNSNSPYFYNNDGHRMMVSSLIIFLSFIAISLFHI